MSGLVVGSLALGAGAGIGSYYLNKPKKQNLNLGAMPYRSLTEFPVGASLNDVILKGLKGEGVGPSRIGFAPEYADRTTSPLVAAREARFKERELPFLESSLGSRGLSRSTLGARDVGRLSAEKERDINEIIGQAYKENEGQKKLDEAQRAREMESFRNAGLSFASGEAGQGNIYADTTAKRREYQIDKEAEFSKAEKENVNKAIGTGVSTAFGFAGGGAGALGGLGGIGGGGSGGGGLGGLGGGSLVSILNSGGGGGGGGNLSVADWTAILNALSRSEKTRNASPFVTQKTL